MAAWCPLLCRTCWWPAGWCSPASRRCVAGDKTSHCAMRNMMACTVTGQGAGTAAAVSLKVDLDDHHPVSQEGLGTHDVDVKVVQEELVRQGVRIH